MSFLIQLVWPTKEIPIPILKKGNVQLIIDFYYEYLDDNNYILYGIVGFFVLIALFFIVTIVRQIVSIFKDFSFLLSYLIYFLRYLFLYSCFAFTTHSHFQLYVPQYYQDQITIFISSFFFGKK